MLLQAFPTQLFYIEFVTFSKKKKQHVGTLSSSDTFILL